ncbi:MAG: SigB/SigF/SigG family RNA polymerase sigma factor [Lachnospiraceae bacterium]|nr:SigB/SigF/SigG family RNA polymerase sigma factor [Lachnospiraceae bacterium]
MEFAELICAAQNGSRTARDQLVCENMGLVWSVVRRFKGRGQEMEDLFQIGSIGLMKAVDKFDLQYQVCFSTYAVPLIAGEIRRFLRDDGMLKVSRSLKEQAYKAGIAREQLGMELGRDPTMEEVAGRMGICVEEVAAALESNAEVESLSRTIYQGDGNAITLMDKLEEERDISEELVNQLVVEQMLSHLPKLEKRLLELRYFKEKTQAQTAKELGITQVQVSRLERKILGQLRKKLPR